MTVMAQNHDAEQKKAEEYMAEHPFGYQDENGIDVSLISESLRLTPDERVRQAQRAAQQLIRMLDERDA